MGFGLLVTPSGVLRAPLAPNSETKNPLHSRAALFFSGTILERALDDSKKENPQHSLRAFDLLVTPSGLLRAPLAPNSETKNPLHFRAALFFSGIILERALDDSKKENPQLSLRAFDLLVTPSGFKPETF